MGLFDFVKAAGKALGFGSEAQASEMTPEEAIKREVDELGLDVKDLGVEIDGDKVKLTGKAVSQEVREKVILAAGNVEGVAQVEDSIDAPGDETGVFHTVVKGDTLWAIAEKHLGNGSKYPQIFEANKPMLSDPDKIYPGQVLRIPQG